MITICFSLCSWHILRNLCIFSRRQQSQKPTDGTATVVMHGHQMREIHSGDHNHQDVDTVVDCQNGIGRMETVTHESASNDLYCDMRGVQPTKKLPRLPRQSAAAAAAAAGKNRSDFDRVSGSGEQSSNYSVWTLGVRKLSARLGRAKPHQPSTQVHYVYENMPKSSIYCNV